MDATHNFASDPVLSLIPHINQYFGPWAIEETQFQGLLSVFRAGDLQVHAATRTPIAQNVGYDVVQGNIAIVQISGAMTKFGSSFSTMGSTVRARKAIIDARKDSAIDGVLLYIDSPGGTVAGTKELADAVYATNADKPVWAVIEDLGASAAYEVASQAGQIFANEPALIGSIGTYMVLYDVSKAFEKAGYDVHVIKAGEMKAAGTLGAPITPDQVAYFQEIVNSFNEFFVKAIERGRGLSRQQVEQLANGKVHLAGDAMALQLIDGIGTFDEVVTKFSQFLKGVRMSSDVQKNATPAAASISELRSACPGADDSFLLKQIESGATIQSAQTAFIAHQQLRQESHLKQVNELMARCEEMQTKIDQLSAMPGNDPIKSEKPTSSTAGDAISQWNGLIEQIQKDQPGIGRQRATVKAYKMAPQLAAAIELAANAG